MTESDTAALIEIACLTVGRKAIPAIVRRAGQLSPIHVACMDESDVSALTGSRSKLVARRYRALINNARRFCEIAATHGSVMAWAREHKPDAKRLSEVFDLGPLTVSKFAAWLRAAIA